ncbi:flagellin [Methylobacterium gnaphalii]|uniref:Flagellin n=1 Tax=Methylobacterium gnaphalii TaxID=1010610 RepID=A0A512JFR6_9HYPH|nr:flagellin [Methylobacterium gnaphalii]GEP08796.1 hypothetical protein MGN01_06410 [Methylobacterium gnaphalii]GJD69386.1 hypothetical protein MMMDOFMJ_2317 [Methylobacterium gnaphalii]GLS47562.1 hypothetical protein GCM10007885_04060 [Methylobacterium gnaphalii]
MSSSVTLSSAVRQNLLSLQDTASLTATTQNRLATGKKVASALDNPVNFFTAQSLSARSGDLGGLLDGISNGIQTIQAANQGITSIQKLVDSAKSIASQALASKNTQTNGTATTAFAAPAADTTVAFTLDGSAKSINLTTADTIQTTVDKLNTAAGSALFSVSGTKIAVGGTGNVAFADAEGAKLGFAAAGADLTVEDKTRTALTAQFNSLLTQIDQLAKDSSYNGVNLLSSSATTNKLHISFNEKDSSSLDVQGVDLTSSGLGLSAIATTGANSNFQADADVNAAVSKLTTASNTLRTQASTFGSNLSVVQNRQDFSKQLINVLDTGAANLTSADLNEEAANSQALSTRQSLGISALSLANQAQQGILQLLR